MTREKVNEIIENGYVKDRAALGIKVYAGSAYSANGVIVTDVTKDGSADKVGIKANDIIVAINDTVVASSFEISSSNLRYILIVVTVVFIV